MSNMDLKTLSNLVFPVTLLLDYYFLKQFQFLLQDSLATAEVAQ